MYSMKELEVVEEPKTSCSKPCYFGKSVIWRKFITNSGIAHRFADTFTLSEEVIEPIKNLIEKGRIY